MARQLLIVVVICSDGIVVYRNEITVTIAVYHRRAVPSDISECAWRRDRPVRGAVSTGGLRRKKIPKRIFIYETTQTPHSREIKVE